MRKLINAMKNLSVVSVGFISVVVMLGVSNVCVVGAIDELTDAVRETKEVEQVQQISMDELTANQQQQVMDMIANNKPEEVIVPVYYEKEASGAMFYTFGDLIMDKYAFGIMIHEGQGIYTYYDYNDHRIECKSLSELQEVIMCHIDQAWPNARFVMEWN